MGPFFHCKKTGHFIVDCPSLQALASNKLHKKKKALKATWDDSKTESDDEEVDITNVCFMANREKTSKVTLETSLDDDELTMGELAKFLKNIKVDMRFQIFKIRN